MAIYIEESFFRPIFPCGHRVRIRHYSYPPPTPPAMDQSSQFVLTTNSILVALLLRNRQQHGTEKQTPQALRLRRSDESAVFLTRNSAHGGPQLGMTARANGNQLVATQSRIRRGRRIIRPHRLYRADRWALPGGIG